MNLPWEAIVTIIIALIGFIGWLTKISVKQDVGLDTMTKIQNTIAVIEATYAKQKDVDKIEQIVQAAHRRIDHIKEKGYDIDKKIGG